MLRQLLQIPYVKNLLKRLRRNPYLRGVCGYGDRASTEAHFRRYGKTFSEEAMRVSRVA